MKMESKPGAHKGIAAYDASTGSLSWEKDVLASVPKGANDI
jgi:hypothetical protein